MQTRWVDGAFALQLLLLLSCVVAFEDCVGENDDVVVLLEDC